MSVKMKAFTVEWSVLKSGMLAALRGDYSAFPNHQRPVETHLVNPDRGWQGYSGDDCRRWLESGYQTSAIQNLGELTPPLRKKRRMLFMEEGDEFHYDIAASGAENFMSSFTDRPRIPGCKIEIALGFSAGVNARVLTEYATWVCKAIYSVISAGIDPEIVIHYAANRMVNGDIGPHDTRILVKKEKEVMDFNSFSPMLSPAQFRAYMFCAMYLHCESLGKTITSGHGSSGGLKYFDGFSVQWNAETGHLLFNCDYNSYGSFPAEKMERDLRNALQEMSH